jgi:hypothetical protein
MPSMVSVVSHNMILVRIEDLIPIGADGLPNADTRMEIVCVLQFDSDFPDRGLEIYYRGHEFYERTQDGWKRSAAVVMPLTSALKSLLVSAIVLEVAGMIGRSRISPMPPGIQAALPAPDDSCLGPDSSPMPEDQDNA